MTSFTSKYKSTPTWTFQSRNQTITTSNSLGILPSPNAYNPQKNHKQHSILVKFATSKRKQLFGKDKKSPGPGHYESKSYITEGPRKSLSTRFIEKISLTPSPGDYNPNTNILKKKIPEFSFPNKPKNSQQKLLEKNSYKPEPGHYETNRSTLDKNKAWKIGNSNRLSQIINKYVPGPGAYDSQHWNNPKVVEYTKSPRLPQASRTIDFSLTKTPGPGSYQKTSFFDSNKVKMKGYSCRVKSQIKIDKSPGPGEYETPLSFKFKSVSSLKIPKNRRDTFIDISIKKTKFVPGPGDHQTNILEYSKYHTLPVHKFPKSKQRGPVLNKNPLISPFSYQNKKDNTINSSPKFSFTKSISQKIKVQGFIDGPGPGHYEPKSSIIFESSSQFRVPKSQRPNVSKNFINKPGPGQYFIIDNKVNRSFKFSKSKRGSFVDSDSQKSLKSQIYQPREIFPNPPKYMNVKPKLTINQKLLKKY